MIRTLQDHAIHRRASNCHMEYHHPPRLLVDGEPVIGAFAYVRERGRFPESSMRKAVVLATGGIGRAFQVTSR